METTNKIIKLNVIQDVIELYIKLVNQNYNIILVLDIDDTVISSSYGQKFVEKEICSLVDLVYSSNPNNLIFLTSRDKSLKKYTLNQLNKIGLLHKNAYINYNIICSPCDEDGNSTKGVELTKYLIAYNDKIFSSDKKNYIIFVDDLMEHINSVKKSLEEFIVNNNNFIDYTLIYYKYKHISIN